MLDLIEALAVIAGLAHEDYMTVKTVADKIRTLVAETGDLGILALIRAGSEITAERQGSAVNN